MNSFAKCTCDCCSTSSTNAPVLLAVASSGLPKAQPDHAIIMAKFANEILIKTQDITLSLEEKLGKGTADLALRVGLVRNRGINHVDGSKLNQILLLMLSSFKKIITAFGSSDGWNSQGRKEPFSDIWRHRQHG